MEGNEQAGLWKRLLLVCSIACVGILIYLASYGPYLWFHVATNPNGGTISMFYAPAHALVFTPMGAPYERYLHRCSGVEFLKAR